ncbi:M15 family metallopeptidase [Nocardia sp. CDC159]|uniref:M15 family metallopeptidase n=2 Tax=Nocardiaceae TaxID=85025 RepID=A0A9X2EFD8_9NOCA|nr:MULTISPECIES: M15 family metallopeptidase [Nocardia]MCM6777948.1 M15 family metallopeptidase [Nocardia pulmonis]MCM6790881.1 M15 family metallopeptidase [Nocardia sp. CDC159]
MCNRDECEIADVPLEFIDTAPIRSGAPLTILGAWMVWYDRHVEEIESPVWGWSATNAVPDSNHLAGVAIDINAPRYPWGRLTMPIDRVARVHQGLDLFEGTVFWGRAWSRPDEMHYQIGYREGAPELDVFAAKLRRGYLGIYPTAAPPVSRYVMEGFQQLLPPSRRTM